MITPFVPVSGSLFGWQPFEWNRESKDHWLGCYHEAAHAIFSHDLACRPSFIDIGGPWGVGHCGCNSEDDWYTVMAAGGAATWLCSEDTGQLDPRTCAIESAHGDLAHLGTTLDAAEVDSKSHGGAYTAPTPIALGLLFEAKMEELAAVLRSNSKPRVRIDALAVYLHGQLARGIARVDCCDCVHLLAP